MDQRTPRKEKDRLVGSTGSCSVFPLIPSLRHSSSLTAPLSARAPGDAFAESLPPSLVCLPEPGSPPLCQNGALGPGACGVCVCVSVLAWIRRPYSGFSRPAFTVSSCGHASALLTLVLQPELWSNPWVGAGEATPLLTTGRRPSSCVTAGRGWDRK